MTEKRFEVVMNEFDEVEYIMDKVAMEDRDFAEFIDFVEDICNENEQLKQEKEELLNKLLECQKALSMKNIREEPHWYKYGNNEGYTAKSDSDIRFNGD